MMPELPDIPEQDWVIEENDIEWSIITEDIDWENDPHMELPEGVKTHTLNQNEPEGRTDFFIRFPRGISNPCTPIPLLTPY
ncbi:hypothetical protein [Haloarcula sp. JP-L23]|uniref:hypothetical protein n=1 Tax=Haloarcula sp. JP-L23 TaxID=2716717 RepID=UPI00140EEE30|nr:hypothetical protein G9465_23365 [Haloarcula sp. JP-L23]